MNKNLLVCNLHLGHKQKMNASQKDLRLKEATAAAVAVAREQ